jgi:hypothetical protein
MKLIVTLAHKSVRHLTRVAAVLALVGLGIMALSVVSPRPLLVILAMSAGHVLGAAAVGCYVLAIVIDATRKPPRPVDSLAPPPPREGAEQGPGKSAAA